MSRRPDPKATAHFYMRVVQDAISEGHAAQLRKRAETFEACRPRKGDWPGRATPEQRREQDRRVRAIAEALRHKAALIEAEARSSRSASDRDVAA